MLQLLKILKILAPIKDIFTIDETKITYIKKNQRKLSIPKEFLILEKCTGVFNAN